MSSRTSGGPEATNKVPDRVIDAPIPDDEYRREFLATLKDSSPAVLKAIAVFHRKRAMVAEAKCARLEAEKQEARKLLEEFPKFPERCVHGEETWYCAGCQCAHERVIGEWNKLRAAILSKPTGEKSPRLDVKP